MNSETVLPFGCFNPHPPLLAGETATSRTGAKTWTVSIHTRHYWRVKPHQFPFQAGLQCFNPHPPLLAGETTEPVAKPRRYRGFNPHPPLLAGETSCRCSRFCKLIVSIHTRHYWRVKLGGGAHPATFVGVSIHTRHYWRVKHPVIRQHIAHAAVSIHTRHYWRVKQRPAAPVASAVKSFNPHPPLLAGETKAGLHIALSVPLFQSTPAITGG